MLIETIEIQLKANFFQGTPLCIIIPTASTESKNFIRCKKSISESELPEGTKIIAIVSSGPSFSFSKSVNRGLAEIKDEDILLLNDDCYVEPNTIKNALDNDGSKVGIVGAVLRYSDGRLQHNGGLFYFNLIRILLRDSLSLAPFYTIRTYLRAKKMKTRYLRTFQTSVFFPKKVDFVTGAFLFIPNRVFKRIGFFDEAFINGFEDADYCLRAKDLGFTVGVKPNAHAIHEEHVSLKTLKSTFFVNLVVFNQKWSKDKVIQLRKSDLKPE